MRSVFPRWIAAAAILAAFVLAGSATPGPRGVPIALADTTPTVTLALLTPSSTLPATDPLPPQVTLKATTLLPAASIASINFESAPADTDNWTSLGMNPTFAGGLPPYTVPVDTTTLTDGLYDFRAVLTETDGTVDDSPTVRDQLIANESPYVTLSGTTTGGASLASGSALAGTVGISGKISDLEADEGLEVASVSLQLSPANAENWTTLSTVSVASNQVKVGFQFDTTTQPDGTYDLRAIPTDNLGDPPDASIPIRGITIDNTPPTVSLVDPGSPLIGRVTLSANATDTGSGVASVEYERAPAGSDAWTQIGSSDEAPFSIVADTSGWANGSYDLEAIATDRAGNTATSNVVTVTSSNPPPPPPTQRAIGGVAVPAHDVTMLGAVAGSPTGEAWAYGYTDAPPATVNGSPLPYAAEGDQFVLLRHSDAGGWQIADVPVVQNPDGSLSPFPLLPADETYTDSIAATGAMAANGEAWLWIYEAPKEGLQGVTPVYGLFHRQENVDGGAFVLDQSATDKLASLVNPSPDNGVGPSLRLGLTNGQVYGVFVNPQQPAGTASVPGADGQVSITEKLQYALLQNGSWQDYTADLPTSMYVPEAGDTVTLDYADVTGPGTGWATLDVSPTGTTPRPLLLGQFDIDNIGNPWTYVQTGLDALDLTGSVANASPDGSVQPTGLKVAGTGDSVWIGATDTLPTGSSGSGASDTGNVVALYDYDSATGTGTVTQSWCTLPVDNSCDEPLDGEHPAAVPDQAFDDGDALSMQDNALDVYENGTWSSLPAPGYTAGDDAFTDPTDGWLGSQSSVIGQLGTQAATSLLASWPLAVRAPLTSVALPPGSDGSVGDAGALAVGFDGSALLYSAADGWLVQPTPAQTQNLYLTSVAFAGPSSAFAVGQFGQILHWDGSSWSEDPQSSTQPNALTENQLNSVAFAADGQGWAVGDAGTILHYDGQSWSIEQPPATDAETDITSVAVSGSDVFAIAGGNLIVRQSDGSWDPAPASLLPSDPPTPGSLRLVSGLPDGGAVIAGVSVVLERQGAGQAFAYSDQPLEGIAVALSAFRDSDGDVGAAVSIAPPAASLLSGTPTADVGGYPAGDGELMIQTADGWQDLSRSQPAGDGQTLPPDGEVKPDPVLGVATSPDGQHAWVVGGYDGTLDSVDQGSSNLLPSSRAVGWQTASLWRYDAGGSATAPNVGQSTPNLPAAPGTVSFAFFSTPMCLTQCSTTPDAQPDTNLTGAISEINSYATEPAGPLFAMLGGNAVGPSNTPDWAAGNGAEDFAALPSVLAPLQIPLFAAYGPLDAVPTETNDQAEPWSDAFANSPQPFGNGGTANGITPVSSGAATPGAVARYYSFDATQNGATLRVIVLDNSQGSLDGSDVGQTAWLDQQLAATAGMPTVVFAALPLYGSATSDGASVAAALVNAGVLAVFTSDYGLNGSQLNQVHQLSAGGSQTIPEYEGATLGYQVSQNDGVVWYDVSVNTQQRTASVDAVPLVQSLALQPLRGQVVARSLTLQFQAIGRRSPGSLPKAVQGDTEPGYDSYVSIPASGCSTCVTPSYSFTSSNPEIGTFVKASGPNSPYPALNASGHPIPDSQSGLFCAYNGGTTTVSITAGLMTASLPVTVQSGGFGSPCGTVPLTGVLTNAQLIEGRDGAPTVERVSGSNPPAPPPPPPPPAPAAASSPAPALAPPPPPGAPVSHSPVPAPRPAPAPAPRPAVSPPPAFAPPPTAAPLLPVLAAVLPPPVPVVEPIPPGGATAPSQAPSAAQRREKARKHASQSASYTLLAPAGSDSSIAWWYEGGVGIATVLALLLAAQGLRPRGRATPARSYVRRR